MGTYTANYQLYMPSIGEQGWGDLMNGNLTTIDTTMGGLNTRIGTLETETDAVEERVTALEPLLAIEVDENQNVTFPADVNINGSLNGIVAVNDGIQTNVIYTSLKTTGSIKVFTVPAINYSLIDDPTTGWGDGVTFTVSTPLFRTRDASLMVRTINYTWSSSFSTYRGGVRCYEDDVLLYTFVGTSYLGSHSFDITLKYGSTYNIQVYANYTYDGSRAIDHTLTANEINHYINT